MTRIMEMGKKHGLLAGMLIFLALFPLFAPRFYIYILALTFATGLFAASLNLPLGFGGMYQFHHAVFYGAGAYAFALTLKHAGAGAWAWAAFAAAPVFAGLLSLLMGIVCARVSKLYFGMLQISLGSLVWVVVYRWYSFTGGDDGIHGIPLPDALSSVRGGYCFALAVSAFSLFILYRIIRSPFGKTLQGVRDNPERCAAVGVNVQGVRLAALVIAGTLAGIAGMLFVVAEGSVFPDLLFWTLSLEALIMCLLGGWRTFWGPVFGAAFIVFLRTFAGIYTEYWTSILGGILIFVIVFMPEGFLGWFEKMGWFGKKRHAEKESSRDPIPHS
ncbi:Branched-chain amino acid ABC transporter permease [Candidatus Desulfarcum epimagneticum]|uniref:Branched-chain amino acid ABC transporter permease n=1 Tax=uncultured Desulfobacteraceae bacterium TaxID=218296 RepID=A0A484HCZ6_9BACT|nr:Branched-chain amino acid ABC transporter permease [uncultured Desulfobacteraceae bacterium]